MNALGGRLIKRRLVLEPLEDRVCPVRIASGELVSIPIPPALHGQPVTVQAVLHTTDAIEPLENQPLIVEAVLTRDIRTIDVYDQLQTLTFPAEPWNIDGALSAYIKHFDNDEYGDVTVIEGTLVVTAPPPASVGTGAPFQVQVSAEDAAGNVIPSFNGNVTIHVASGPANATFGGTHTVAAVNGVATFSGLTLDTAGIYTLQATASSLTPARTNAFVVGNIANLEEIEFTGTGNVNIQIDGSTVIGDPTGASTEDIQWVRGLREGADSGASWDTTQSAPAAFIKGYPLRAQVTFSVADLTITSITVGATDNGLYGDFPDTVIPISSGTGTGTFVTSDPSDDAVDVQDITFQWVLKSVTAGGQVIAQNNAIRQTTHRIYTLEAAPIAPMDQPWATVLELSAGLARGLRTDAAIAAQETRGIHYSLWQQFDPPADFLNPQAALFYAPGASRTSYVSASHTPESQEYDLTGFMSLISGPGIQQQCDGNANLLSIFARSLGVPVSPLWIAHTYPLPPQPPPSDLMVRTTFYPAGSDPSDLSTRPSRYDFNFHQIGLFDGNVYDTCARPSLTGDPYLGMSLADYLDAAFPGQLAAGIVLVNVTSLTIAPVPFTIFGFHSLAPNHTPTGTVTPVVLDGSGFDTDMIWYAIEQGSDTLATGVTVTDVTLVSANEVDFNVAVAADATPRTIVIQGFDTGLTGDGQEYDIANEIDFTIDPSGGSGGGARAGGSLLSRMGQMHVLPEPFGPSVDAAGRVHALLLFTPTPIALVDGRMASHQADFLLTAPVPASFPIEVNMGVRLRHEDRPDAISNSVYFSSVREPLAAVFEEWDKELKNLLASDVLLAVL